jgi:cell division protein FtsI/penicillin-binding protein 2
VNIHEMLVGGSDSAGKQVALALRKSAGSQKVLADFRRYGFNRATESLWAEVDPQWRKRLTPPPAYAAIDTLNDEDWNSALSIGESYMVTTALQVSRFLQGIGNNGLLCAPVARSSAQTTGYLPNTGCNASTRMVEEDTARRLRAAMVDTIKRGTATRIAGALKTLDGRWEGRPAPGAGPERR